MEMDVAFAAKPKKEEEEEDDDRKTIKKSEERGWDRRQGHFPLKQFESKFCMSQTLLQMSYNATEGSTGCVVEGYNCL